MTDVLLLQDIECSVKKVSDLVDINISNLLDCFLVENFGSVIDDGIRIFKLFRIGIYFRKSMLYSISCTFFTCLYSLKYMFQNQYLVIYVYYSILLTK